MRRAKAPFLLVLLLAIASASAQPLPHPGTPMPDALAGDYALSPLNQSLVLPVGLWPFDDGSGRFLVAQLEGLVMVVHPDGELSARPFLDLRHRVTALRGEQGLFTIALESAEHAAAAGRVRQLVAAYVDREDQHLVFASYPVDPALMGADAGGEVLLLSVPMPEPFHHGGQVLFGRDGFLYMSVGDGQSSSDRLKDPPFPAQDLSQWRGKVLRVDLLPQGQNGPAYTVPSDNPFVGVAGALPEIWALGLRNPWKMGQDPVSGDLYVSDVGEDRWEEINHVLPGGNYGWPAREGRECQLLPFDPGYVEAACPEQDHYVDPLVAIGHLRLDPNGSQSVTGGAFAFDAELPELHGHFVFGDFISGRVWSFDPTSGEIRLLLHSALALTEIAGDADGRIWLLGIQGSLSRLVHSRVD